MAGIVGIYRESGVVLPRSMFGHTPVYPPVTLLLLWPLTYLSMGQSAVAWLVTSATASAVALAMVLREARRQGLHWSLRLGMVAFAAGAPVLGYALDIGNVSPAVGALTTISLLMALRESHRSFLDCWGYGLPTPFGAVWLVRRRGRSAGCTGQVPQPFCCC